MGASKGIFEFGPRWDTESTLDASPEAIEQTEQPCNEKRKEADPTCSERETEQENYKGSEIAR